MIQAIRRDEEHPPCFGRQWCSPRQYRACACRKDCGARLETAQGLVLSDNIIIGYQIAFLLGSCGWRMQVVHTDKQAYEIILKGNMDIVVADIDAAGLGGLATLVYCQRRWPSIKTFAVTRGDDAYLEKLASDMGGCQGFFYLSDGKLELDTCSGMAAGLVRQASRINAAKAAPLRPA
ncbi:MAG TPA: hypothetical protein VNH42_07160 [Mariprofundaceae bacterium]|nr:hypothetical protein [Mariprofundaceae bacterium]